MAQSKLKKQPNQVKSKAWITRSAVFIVLVVLLVIVVLRLSLFQVYPVHGTKESLVIRSGDNYSAFIDRLAAENKVKFPMILKLYRKLFIHESMKAGVYEVPKGMTIQQLLELLSNAENAYMTRLLIIEGTTTKQLLQSLQKDPNIVKTLDYKNHASIIKALGVPYSHLEGIFAPNTYFYDKGSSDLEILKDLYQRQMKILDEAWQKRAADLPYKNKYEALIMASIIEKETSLDRELNKVSGVFVRRLKLNMRLQTDPTVIYGMGERYQGKITRQDLRTATPYNTYTIHGLPPSPIALAGKKAIEAAMHPDQSQNLYFVATGNGGHTFSRNLDDHNRAVQTYIQVMRAKKQE
ncbi:endolytic transglycosylase MltG [Acinetobacter larvae]|uniref:Endolytic murein transglycosylase n=1 Tax=Acinetobacter larvae TaxID=1789224 RepID=A0A1B2LXS4_9GAMM|nr:endolytic transglycosylase MltG [Acinetobacter larvae]AOA57689.1 hypothetical protein BFG52_04485 [Acinetobacter larvae]